MCSAINLYLDDLRDCPSGFTVARNVEEAINYFEHYTINLLSLDHDLGEDAKGNLLPTGYDFVKMFCERGYRANKIYIHTDNGAGEYSQRNEPLMPYFRATSDGFQSHLRKQESHYLTVVTFLTYS